MSAHAVAQAPREVSAYFSAYEQMDQIVAQLRSPQAQLMKHHEIEDLLKTQGDELLRRLLQAHLDERAPGLVTTPVVGADGQERTHQRLHTRHIKTIFGAVSLTRQGYGGHGLESLHPLDAELNLPPERYSHTLQRTVAEAAAKESFDEVVATVEDHTAAVVPKRQAEELAGRAAQDFEPFYESQRAASSSEVKATSPVLIITTDGKGLLVRNSDLREATRQAAAERAAASQASSQSRRKTTRQTHGHGRRRLYDCALGAAA